MIRFAVVLTYFALLQATSAFYIDFNDGYFQEQEINIINRPYLNPYNPTQILPLASKHLPRHHLNKSPIPPAGIPPLPPTPPQWPFPPMQGSAPLPVPNVTTGVKAPPATPVQPAPPVPKPQSTPPPPPPLPQPQAEPKPQSVPQPKPEQNIPIPSPNPISKKPSVPQPIPKPQNKLPNPPQKNETSPTIPAAPKPVTPEELPAQTTINNVQPPTQVLSETKPNPQVSTEKNPFIPHLLKLKQSPSSKIIEPSSTTLKKPKTTIPVPPSSTIQLISKPCNGVCIPGPIEPHHLAGLKNFKPNIPVALRPPKPLPCNGLCVPFESEQISASEKIPEIQKSGLEDRPSVSQVSLHKSTTKVKKSVHLKPESKIDLVVPHPIPTIKISAVQQKLKSTLPKPLKRLQSFRKSHKSSRRNSAAKVISLPYVMAPSNRRLLSNRPHSNVLKLPKILEEPEPDSKKSKLKILSQRKTPSRVIIAREITPKPKEQQQPHKNVRKSVLSSKFKLPKSEIGLHNLISHELIQQGPKVQPAKNLTRNIAHGQSIFRQKNQAKPNVASFPTQLHQKPNVPIHQDLIRPPNISIKTKEPVKINPPVNLTNLTPVHENSVFKDVEKPNFLKNATDQQNVLKQELPFVDQNKTEVPKPASPQQNPLQGKPLLQLQPLQLDTQHQNIIKQTGPQNLVETQQNNYQLRPPLPPGTQQQSVLQKNIKRNTTTLNLPARQDKELLVAPPKTINRRPFMPNPLHTILPEQGSVQRRQQLPAQELLPNPIHLQQLHLQPLQPQQNPIQQTSPQHLFAQQPLPDNRQLQKLNTEQTPQPEVRPRPVHSQHDAQLPKNPQPPKLLPTQQLSSQPVLPQHDSPQPLLPQQISPQQLSPQSILPPQVSPQRISQQRISPQPIQPQQIPPQQLFPQQFLPQRISPQPISPQRISPQPISPQPISPQPLLPQQLSPGKDKSHKLQPQLQKPIVQQIPPTQEGVQQQVSTQPKLLQQNSSHPISVQQNVLQQGSLHPNVLPQMPSQQNRPPQFIPQQVRPQLFSPQQNPLIPIQRTPVGLRPSPAQQTTLQGQFPNIVHQGPAPQPISLQQSNLKQNHSTSNKVQLNPIQSPAYTRFPPRGVAQPDFSSQRFRTSINNHQPFTQPLQNLNQVNQRPNNFPGQQNQGFPLERPLQPVQNQQNRPAGSFYPNPNYYPIPPQGGQQFNAVPQHPSTFNNAQQQNQYNINNNNNNRPTIQQTRPDVQYPNVSPLQQNYPNTQYNNYRYPQNPYPNNNIPTNYIPQHNVLSYPPQPPNNPLPLPQLIKSTGINQQNGPATKPNFTLPTKNLTQPN